MLVHVTTKTPVPSESEGPDFDASGVQRVEPPTGYSEQRFSQHHHQVQSLNQILPTPPK